MNLHDLYAFEACVLLLQLQLKDESVAMERLLTEIKPYEQNNTP